MITSSVTIGDQTVPLAIRSSKQARRISLRISPGKNQIIMTLPRRASLASGMKFLDSKTAWLLDNIVTDLPIVLADRTCISILEMDYLIKHVHERGITRLDSEARQLIVHCQPEFIERRIKDFLKKLLREECIKRSGEMAAMLGKKVTKVTITEASSRWGSCSAKGALAFNWLFIFAPLPVLEYIIAHETAHLKEMNHSVHFWKLVEQLCPHMRTARKWLKSEGYRLHRYG